jgi:geranylgeranylglycerol-phosphate geranylgeranyltransferase
MNVKAMWQLTRLEHGLMLGSSVIIGMIISDDVIISISDALLGFLTVLLISAGIFALNDYCDMDVDIANDRADRPLVRGELQPRDALIIASIATPIGILCSFLLENMWCFALAVITAGLGIVYDVKMKEAGVPGNAYIAFTMAIPFVFGGLIIRRVPFVLLIFSSMAFLSGFGREVMKGIVDVKGDALRDVKTIARVYGIGKAKIISVIFYMIAVLLTFFPFIFDMSGFRNHAYLFLILIADSLFAYVCYELYKSKDREKVNELRNTTLVAMIVGLIAFLCGSI